MVVIKGVLIVVALLAAAVLLAGRLGGLSGSPPGTLGVRDGRLAPPSSTPNSVSSQAGLYPDHPMRAYAEIAPLPMRGDAAATLAALDAVIRAMPGATLVRAEPGYRYATFTTRWLRFVDDVELWADPASGVVHVRSASRLGRKDFGVNRARVEALRAALAAR
jgi:uncharacterized protein (DUF1499 family)